MATSARHRQGVNRADIDMPKLTWTLAHFNSRLHVLRCVPDCAVPMKCRLQICMLIEGGLHACVDMSGPFECF
jgi:hypothetical protein